MITRRVVLTSITLLGLALQCRAAEELPTVRVEKVRRVFHDGDHNAFTDLTHWQGRFWLTFRSCPDGHAVHPTASVVVLSSDDAQDWRPVHRFSVTKRDTRDPHFLAFRGKLFVYTGTWYCGDGPPAEYDLNKHLGYAAWTEDGSSWEGPRPLEGTYGHYIWRAATAPDGHAYLCGRRNREHAQVAGEGELSQSAMLKSEDGFVWRFVSMFQVERGDETAFRFLSDGDALAIARREPGTAQLVRSSPPYRDWSRKELSFFVGGPLLAPWGDRWLVGGRLHTDRGPKTTLYWLQDEQLHPCAELPSGGDNSYPGFVALDDERGLVSWYSSHEQDEQGRTITAIYLAELRLEEK